LWEAFVAVADRTTSELPRNLIRFLRDCYEADNREAALFDLRHERVQHLHVLNHGGDFLTGNLDLIPVDRKLALEVQKTARLYETERTLVFCAFLLVGKIRNPLPPLESDTPRQRLCQPVPSGAIRISDASLLALPIASGLGGPFYFLVCWPTQVWGRRPQESWAPSPHGWIPAVDPASCPLRPWLYWPFFAWR